MPTTPGKSPRRRRMIALGMILLAISVGGAGLAWWQSEPWPVSVFLAVAADDTIQGFSADERCLIVDRFNPMANSSVPVAYDLATGAIRPNARSAPRDVEVVSHDGVTALRQDQGIDPESKEWGTRIIWFDARSRLVCKWLPIPGYFIRRLAFTADDQSVRAVLTTIPKISPNPTDSTLHGLTWNLTTGAAVIRPVLIKGGKPMLNSIALSPLVYSGDGRLCAAFDALDGPLRIWDLETGQSIGPAIPIKGDLAVHFIGMSTPYALAPDGRTLALIHRDGRADLVDMIEARLIRTIPLHTPGLWAASPGFSPNSRLLVSAAGEEKWFAVTWYSNWLAWAFPSWTGKADLEIAVADIASGRILARVQGEYDVRFAPDGRKIVSRTQDGSIIVRDTPRPPTR